MSFFCLFFFFFFLVYWVLIDVRVCIDGDQTGLLDGDSIHGRREGNKIALLSDKAGTNQKNIASNMWVRTI